MGTGKDPYVVGKQVRAAGGIVIQINDMQFHIDPGVGAVCQAARCGINLRANTAVLCSHNHIYHCNDINAVIDAMTYSGFDKNGVLIANNTVVNGSYEEKAILAERYKAFLERFIVLQPNHKAGIGDVEIMAIKTMHKDTDTVGFKFITPEFTLSYSADTKYSKEVVEGYKNSSILILNVPFSRKESAKDSMNLCCEDVVKIIEEVKPRLVIITHFGAEMIKADPLYEAREIQKKTNVQVIAAKDGMAINPLSYSVNVGQRTLKTFSKEEIREEPKQAYREEQRDLNQ